MPASDVSEPRFIEVGRPPKSPPAPPEREFDEVDSAKKGWVVSSEYRKQNLPSHEPKSTAP